MTKFIRTIPKCMIDNNNRLLQIKKKKKNYQKTNDKPRGHTCCSSLKANLSNNKGLPRHCQEKAHNPTERWTKANYIVNKKGTANHL